MSLIRKIYCRLTGAPYTDKEFCDLVIKKIREGGGYVGKNVSIYVSEIDLGEPYLIHIGDNVTITGAKILTHDASTKMALGYTKCGKVHIGDNVFIGTKSVILPSTTIGNNVIIGACSVVATDVPDNVVAFGNPLRIICTYDEYIEKQKQRMDALPVIDMLPKDIMNDEESKNRLKKQGEGFVL